jgi:hypothetical protein
VREKTAKVLNLLVLSLLLAAILSSVFYLIYTGLSRTESSLSDSYAICPSSEGNTCGAGALYAALARLGGPFVRSQVRHKLASSEKGASFGQLKSVAEQYGFEASLGILTWEELFSDQTAVLWIRDNHFVAVDPRQKNPSGTPDDKLIRVYDEDKPAQWWDQQELERVWHGEAMIIKKRRSSKQFDGPHIEWDNCYQDCGFVDRDTPARYTFNFRNVGNMPLSVEVLDSGCACSEATLSAKRVGPGQRGRLDVQVDLGGKRGYFQTYVVLTTNDPDQSQNMIYVGGGARARRVLASCENLYLGNVHQGQSLSKQFFVYDNGEKKLALNDVQLKRSDTDVAGSVDTSVRFRRLEVDSDIRSLDGLGAYRAKPGDYVVTVCARAVADCPQGRFSGQLLVLSNLVSDLGQVRVSFHGTVVSDVIAEPRALLLMSGRGAQPYAELRLMSLSGRPVCISEVSTEGAISIEKVDIVKGANEVLVKTAFGEPDVEDPTVQGSLVFCMANRAVLRVPVVIHCSR